ncbi:L-rhamnose catabolism isomerase [soil metagenome]
MTDKPFAISSDFIATENQKAEFALAEDYAALARQLARRGLDIENLTQRAEKFAVAVPTWGVGTGGTRFARFPGPGEPRHLYDKLEDCGVIHQLVRVTPTISPHIPWDIVSDYNALRQMAASHELGFDAVNSNTFQDHKGRPESYKFGSLSHADKAVRAQAIEHNIECIEIGRKLGSTALTIWIADGSNFPGQSNLNAAFDRCVAAVREIYDALPRDWLVFLEHKLYEPAFYSTVIADWGSSLMAANELGPKAKCLVDLGHHAPTTNIEQIVARLVRVQKLAGFHFNDSKYGDDDLDSGSIDPFRLFLVFNELVDAESRKAPGFAPAYMIDQSHNVTDPIESLMQSAMEITRAYVQASLIDRAALAAAQDESDVMGSHLLVKQAYTTDVSPILAEARRRKAGAINPIATYRAAGYRTAKTRERPPSGIASAGIV